MSVGQSPFLIQFTKKEWALFDPWILRTNLLCCHLSLLLISFITFNILNLTNLLLQFYSLSKLSCIPECLKHFVRTKEKIINIHKVHTINIIIIMFLILSYSIVRNRHS